MGEILTDARGLVTPPKDPYWDAPLTRREAQLAVNQLSENDMGLMNMMDTNNIVLNFICEKLMVKREQIEAYVELKKKQLAELKAKEAEKDAKPNS